MTKLLQKKYLVYEKLHYNGITIAMQVFYYTIADWSAGVDRLCIWDINEALGKIKGYKNWKNYTIA